MVCGDIIVESGLLNTDLFCLFHVNSRMNQVEIQNDNLGPTIDQTEDMHMEKAK
jgi:hypothetical protein